MTTSIFEKIGIKEFPIIMAPLAGITDYPFRKVCDALGASLTYVEMISSAGLVYENERTFEMMKDHRDSLTSPTGIQLVGRSVEEISIATKIIEKCDFETIDLNMGCPASKVIKTGSGGALLKDPQKIFEIVSTVRKITKKPLSVKVRLGWSPSSVNIKEVGDAVQNGGADWITIHGRTRGDDYSVPVNLRLIAEMKAILKIPVVGNGNIFSGSDAVFMIKETGVDGVMVARGALGNPWIYREIRQKINKSIEHFTVTPEEWLQIILKHIDFQEELFIEKEQSRSVKRMVRKFDAASMGAVCLRKHLLWYSKGWQNSKKLREKINVVASLKDARDIITEFADFLIKNGVKERAFFNDEATLTYRYNT